MYLTQMGEIPLLTRQQEIALAKQIEITRARFRRKLLECDYVIQDAPSACCIACITASCRSTARCRSRVTDRLEKDQILGRLPHNLPTLDVLLKRERRRLPHRDEQELEGRAKRRDAWRRLGRRRRRAVLLVEELGLRTQRIEPMIGTLEAVQHADRRA